MRKDIINTHLKGNMSNEDYLSYIEKYRNTLYTNSKILEILKNLHKKYHSNYPNNREEAIYDYLSVSKRTMIGRENSLKPNNISKFIFLHILKTGGTSFNSIFTRPTLSKESVNYTIDNFYYNKWEYNIFYMNFPFYIKNFYRNRSLYYWKIIPENACSGNMYKNLNHFLEYHNNNYSHIHFSLNDMVSNADVVINNIDYFHQNNYKIITILRDPINRIQSEYNFLKEYTKKHTDMIHTSYITSKLIDCNNIQDYIYHHNCHNYQIGYLYGITWMSNYTINETQLNKLIDMIKKKYIYIGILENMPETETYFSNILNTEIKIPKRHKTRGNTVSKLTTKDKQYLMGKNKLDYRLYNFAKDYLLSQVS